MQSLQRHPKREQIWSSYFGLSRLSVWNVGTLHYHGKLRMASGQTNGKRRGWLRDHRDVLERLGTYSISLSVG